MQTTSKRCINCGGYKDLHLDPEGCTCEGDYRASWARDHREERETIDQIRRRHEELRRQETERANPAVMDGYRRTQGANYARVRAIPDYWTHYRRGQHYRILAEDGQRNEAY